MNNGAVALSYGKIGITTNGGTTWDTTCYEPQPTWFYDVTYVQDDTCLGVGNYGVAHRCVGDGYQENVSHYIWKDPNVWDFATVDQSPNSSILYAAGEKKSGTVTIEQRYLPSDFTLNSASVSYSQYGSYHCYEIEIKWYTTYERNTRQWWIGRNAHSYLMYMSAFGSDTISAAGYSDTLVEYTFIDTLQGNAFDGN